MIGKIGGILAGVLAVPLAVALGLIASQRPAEMAGDDEAFFADRYEPVMSRYNDRGRYRLVEGVSHLGIVDAPETRQAIAELLDEL
ncbi:hypothetical protein [Thalassovita aquimarina]|uniref:Uncharacterized protein n=1 Tax=Thalassovita aquimarina TaxID=2785917 RepID=A0ABS5HS49_9RHOB|nr:hypothetical protein [Thalassovita aquimarina]MBR9651801.1 hypothetical protein [Thalassovita aquimarina]